MSRKPKRLEPFGIKGIEVSRFRAMHDLEIGLGQLVTVIAGQNGTSKSTILGMLGQPFGLRDRRTIFGRPFSTKFTDIFNIRPSTISRASISITSISGTRPFPDPRGSTSRSNRLSVPQKTNLPFVS